MLLTWLHIGMILSMCVTDMMIYFEFINVYY